jgi:Flp pilus assembly protein TadG
VDKIIKPVASRILGLPRHLRARIGPAARDERGATAIFFAFGLLLLAPATLGLVDIYMVTTQRGQLQDALDTATLYAARSEATTNADIQAAGDASLRANLRLPAGQEITSSTFVLDGIKVKGRATVTPPGVLPEFWAQADIAADSEVLRNSNNVEVAIVLDTTGSMSQQMDSLKTAAKDLVNLVVKDPEQQKVYYTKAAVVPYSVGVNLGSYADAGRGVTRMPTTITDITKASPAVVSSAGHGLRKGEKVFISNVNGMTNFNDKEYTVGNVTAGTFELASTDSTKYSKYSSGGRAACVAEGCYLLSFKNVSGNTRRFVTTPCATERTGAQAYTDAAPSVALAGRHYAGVEGGTPASNTGCKSGEIVPLTGIKKTLTDKIDSLVSDGSTAGQIGLAWGWYMISPEWSSLWEGESTPAPYDQPHTLKVVVLMTDGAFNTTYCTGVNSRDGFGNNADRNECNATNGGAFAQAAKLCESIKEKRIIIYTVGFNVGSDTSVKNFMNSCATSPEFVYMPSGGAELKVAFRAIAQDINSLRISK